MNFLFVLVFYKYILRQSYGDYGDWIYTPFPCVFQYLFMRLSDQVLHVSRYFKFLQSFIIQFKSLLKSLFYLKHFQRFGVEFFIIFMTIASQFEFVEELVYISFQFLIYLLLALFNYIRITHITTLLTSFFLVLSVLSPDFLPLVLNSIQEFFHCPNLGPRKDPKYNRNSRSVLVFSALYI